MARIIDGLMNAVAQMGAGIGKSKLTHDQFSLREMSPAELDALYRSDWLGRKIVDAPIDDTLREGRAWQAKASDIEAIEEAEERHELFTKLSRALKLARLYGGSAIVIGADVSNPELPLDYRRVTRGGLKYLSVHSRHELIAGEIDLDPQSPTFGKPLYYYLNSGSSVQIRLHPSRVAAFIGADRLDLFQNRDGYGDSILAATYDAIHNAALCQSSIAEMLHEAKVDILTIPNLSSLIGTAHGESAFARRFATANAMKSINNTLVIGDGETWNSKQLSFAGLPDVLDRYLQIVSGASDIPATRLIGQAPKGMSSTGESDLRNYYDGLVGKRKQAFGAQLDRLDHFLWHDAVGRVPDGAFAIWRPLWQLTPKEAADIGKIKSETTKVYAELGILDENALRDGVHNQLIEDGIYPGLEAAIEKYVQSAGAREVEKPAAENDNSEADRADKRIRA